MEMRLLIRSFAVIVSSSHSFSDRELEDEIDSVTLVHDDRDSC